MEKKSKEDYEPSEAVEGSLNILGLKLDLGKLLSSPEDLTSQLERLRERLKGLGGAEVLSDEEWKQGTPRVSGHVRIRGLAGNEEYHIGTVPGRRPPAKEKPAEPPEVVEPPLDIFVEPHGVIVIADVPGTGLEDLEIEIEGRTLTISTRATARRAYKKSVRLDADVEKASLETSCRNGVLEIRLRKSERAPGS